MKLWAALIPGILFYTLCYSQEVKIESDSIKVIAFDVQHSLRLYYNHFHVNITSETLPKIHVKSDCIDKKCSKLDTTYKLSNDDFYKVREAVVKVSSIDIEKAEVNGTDGVICSIGFRYGRNWKWYRLWSPDYRSKERDTKAYVDACKLIMKTAGIKYRKFL